MIDIKKNLLCIKLTTIACLCVAPQLATAADFDESLINIQHRWAEANYRHSGKAQKNAFSELLDQARKLSTDYPNRPEALIWQGIVASTYAGVKGPFGAMSLAKEAREALHKAESLDPTALEGSVYTSLGTLYHKVPGGLLGFGDDRLAQEYLEKAVAENPTGIDPNYFYGEYLYDTKDYEAAKDALLAARRAPPRQGRSLADEGRRDEIAALLIKVNRKLRGRS